ncbi:hypothetical protein AB6A40_009762 [Gnathostoma spinigerum]|uniref:Ricin B lectin domain-containing protein n=1 Tax=Gnathostoma spinigerum TaxID=75299 RepID=A0ABD6F0I8_9BILA
MDDYKEHLYKRMPQLRNTDEGDLSKQKAIRKLLKCKSFDWFMKTIAFDQDKYYPAVEPPDSANGTLRNIAAKKCINSDLSPFGLEECEKKHGQLLRFSFWLDVRQLGSTQCFDVSTSVHRAPIVLFSCHGMQGNQHFKYYADKKSLFHPVSNLCLDCDVEAGSVFMSKCDATKETQQWEWSFLDVKLMNERNTENKIKK